MEAQAATAADALRGARRPLVVCGTAIGDVRLIRLAAAITQALATSEREPLLSLVVPECNSVGLALFDAAGALEDAFDALHAGEASALVILENDLHRRLPKATVDAALARAQHVIALDVVHSATTARAELVLPATTFAEGDGTLVNAEGRAQRFFQVLEPDNDFQPGALRDSWRWLGDAAHAGWHALDDVVAACARTMPPFALIRDAAPPAHWRIKGLKIARETHRASGRTAMRADRTVHEPKPTHDPDSALTFTMEGYQGRATPAALTPIFWAPGWNSEQATHRFQQEVNGPLAHGPAGVRLFDAQAATAATPPTIEIPPAFERRDGAYLLLPLDHVFGSDELSAHASAVAQRSVQPYVALNAEDAARLGVVAGEWLAVSLQGQRCQLPLVVRAQLPRGVAGVPRGVGGIAWGTAPQWVGIAPAVVKA
jgi:NADH-quinone oxidoreductase subunit G